jgi:tetratricopeptide (TPR) repeat protein
VALVNGELDRAGQLIGRGRQLTPANPRWAELEAQLATRRRQLAEAAQARRDQAEAARQAAAAVARATDLLAANDYDGAIAAFRRALDLDPSNQAAQNGLTQAVTLQKQAEIAAAAPVAVARREFRESETECLGGDASDAPAGFVADGGVAARRATADAGCPGQIIIEINPPDARPGQPYELTVRLNNRSNKALHLKSLELVSRYGDKVVGRGQAITVGTRRVEPQSTATIHTVPGKWLEEQSRGGSIAASIALVGGPTMRKSIEW